METTREERLKTPLRTLWALAGLLALILTFQLGIENGISMETDRAHALIVQAYQEGRVQAIESCPNERPY